MATKRNPPIEEYTIGWVCSLDTELAAAVEMLDETHEDIPLHRNDTNLYTLGRIGEHNVVITCLPTGQAGTHSAAVVTTQMTSKFVSIRFGLMVGIGSGVPSPVSDIRLGDVVISQPHSVYGGVVQFDSGKIGREEAFTRTGFLNAPPAVLLSALTKFRSNRYRDKSSFSSNLSALSGLLGFTYESAGPDILFKPDSRHIRGQSTCDRCGQEEQEERPPRLNHEAVIHYGTIASGNCVIDDGLIRNKKSEELGGVLCFETEAAGLMNTFPCLVVRGICDYADSHKSNRWHRYASATAAACAKELISIIPSTEVFETRSVGARSSSLLILDLPDFTHDDSQYYVGREDVLYKLQERLRRADKCEDNQHARAALFGLGGVGKSQTAIKYAHWQQKDNPKCSVFWIYAATADRFHQSFRKLAQKLGINDDKIEDAKLSVLVRNRLVADNIRPWLMIIDNADDIDMFYCTGDQCSSKGLAEYIPKCSHGSVLITTRNKQLALEFGGTIQIPELTELESAEFVKKKLELSDSKAAEQVNEIRRLTEQLGHLPLALVQATAFMQRNSSKIKDYLDIYEKSEDKMIKLLSQEIKSREIDSGSLRAVSTTWTISFDQIKNKRPSATHVLSLMAFLDRQGIPKSLILREKDDSESGDDEDIESSDDEDESEDEDDGEDEDENADLHFVEDIGILSAYSLITESDGQYNLHRLVQLVMRHSMKDRNEAGIYKALALKRVATSHPDPTDPRKWGKCQSYYPHAQTVLQYNVENPKEKKWRASLLSDVGMYLSEKGQSRKGEGKVLKALDIRIKELGEEHRDTISSMTSLAIIYQRCGNWHKAEELYLRVVQVLEKSNKTTLRDKLNAMGNLANIYLKQEKLEDAQKLLNNVLGVMRSIKDPKSEYIEDKLKSMMDLASAYFDQGKWDEARKLRDNAVKESKDKLGDRNPLKWTCIAELALTYLSGGEYDKAADLQSQVKEKREKIFELDHPDVLTSKEQLASTYREQGRWEDAEDLQAFVVAAFRRTLGSEHPNTLTAMSNLAFTHDLQGRWKEAAEQGEETIGVLEKTLGRNNSRTLTAMATLAHTYRNLGRWKKAEDLADQVMVTRKKILPENHPDILKIMGNLASTYRIQGRFIDAEKLDEHVWKMRVDLMSDKHPLTLQSVRNLASTYWGQGRWTAAGDLMSMAVRTSETTCGPEHPDTIASMNSMALIYQKQGRWQEAESLGLQVVEMSRSILGEQHPDTFVRMGNLATTYRNQQRLGEAEELENQVVQKLELLIDGQHYLKLRAKYEQASTYRNRGRLGDAEKLGVQVMDVMKKEIGEKHPDTLAAMSGLISIYQKQGRWKDTVEIGERVTEMSKEVLGLKHPDTLARIDDLALTYRKLWMFVKLLGLR